MNDDTLSERGNSRKPCASCRFSRNVAREIAGRDGRFHGAKLDRKLTPGVFDLDESQIPDERAKIIVTFRGDGNATGRREERLRTRFERKNYWTTFPGTRRTR